MYGDLEYELLSEFDHALKSALIDINTTIANQQYIAINEMKMFVDKQNYRGEEYEERRNQQIDANKFWIERFFPDDQNYEKAKKNIMNETEVLVKLNNDAVFNLMNKIDFR